jgi:hypothetical protein
MLKIYLVAVLVGTLASEFTKLEIYDIFLFTYTKGVAFLGFEHIVQPQYPKTNLRIHLTHEVTAVLDAFKPTYKPYSELYSKK